MEVKLGSGQFTWPGSFKSRSSRGRSLELRLRGAAGPPSASTSTSSNSSLFALIVWLLVGAPGDMAPRLKTLTLDEECGGVLVWGSAWEVFGHKVEVP